MTDRSEDFELSVKHPTGILLWKVSNQWVKAQNQALRPFGIGHAQMALLFLIGQFGAQGKEATQVKLAGLSEMDAMVVSQSLRSLETKKLIKRRVSRYDSRAKAARLTKAGEKTVDAALGIVHETNDRFYAGLGSNEGTLRACLQQLLDDNAVD